MSDDPKQDMLTQCARFLENRVDFFDHLDSIGTIAFAIAVGLLLIQGLAATWALTTANQTKSTPDEKFRTSALPSVGEIIKAIPGVVDSLAKAPATVILITLGLLLVWLPDFAPSQACVDLTKEEQVEEDQTEQRDTPEQGPTETPTQ